MPRYEQHPSVVRDIEYDTIYQGFDVIGRAGERAALPRVSAGQVRCAWRGGSGEPRDQGASARLQEGGAEGQRGSGRWSGDSERLRGSGNMLSVSTG